MVPSEVAPVAVLGNSVAMVAPALLPSAVIVIPRMGTSLGKSASHLPLVLGGTAMGLLRSLHRSIRLLMRWLAGLCLLMLWMWGLLLGMLVLCGLRFLMLVLCRLRLLVLWMCRLLLGMRLLSRVHFLMLWVGSLRLLMRLLCRLRLLMLGVCGLLLGMLLPLCWFAVLLSLLLLLCIGRSNGSEQNEQDSHTNKTAWFHGCYLHCRDFMRLSLVMSGTVVISWRYLR